jgi:mono/diheme cytochrome c family protein
MSAPQAQANNCHLVSQELLLTLKAMNAKLDALGGGKAPPAGEAPERPGAAKHSRLSVFAAKCAGCHLAGQEKKGGGLVLLANPATLAPLTPDQAAAVLIRTYGSHPKPMPPRDSGVPPLTDEEYAAVIGSPSPAPPAPRPATIRPREEPARALVRRRP